MLLWFCADITASPKLNHPCEYNILTTRNNHYHHYIYRERIWICTEVYVHISRTATFAHLKNSTFGIRWWQNWVKAQSNMKNETWIERAKRILFTRTHIWSTEMIEILAGLWTLLVLGVVVQTQERSLQSTLLTWKIYTITLLT